MATDERKAAATFGAVWLRCMDADLAAYRAAKAKGPEAVDSLLRVILKRGEDADGQ